MIPVEIEVPSHRRIHFNQAENEELQLEALDFLDEKRKRLNSELQPISKELPGTSIPVFCFSITIRPCSW